MADESQPVWSQYIYQALKDAEIGQVAYVPDAGHKDLIALCHADAGMRAVSLTTEEEGVALLAGAWLGGVRGVILMQSSGVGNCILQARNDALVVTGLGSPTWDVAAIADSPHNFYLWGAMGGAAMLGLGLALAQPSRRVVVVTGDGELLMGLGSLATIGAERPSNLSVVVLDNERYGETGMQASHTARGVDLAAMARVAGFPEAATVAGEPELRASLSTLYGDAGPVLLVVKVLANQPPLRVPLRDGTHIKNRFREALLGPKAFG